MADVSSVSGDDASSPSHASGGETPSDTSDVTDSLFPEHERTARRIEEQNARIAANTASTSVITFGPHGHCIEVDFPDFKTLGPAGSNARCLNIAAAGVAQSMHHPLQSLFVIDAPRIRAGRHDSQENRFMSFRPTAVQRGILNHELATLGAIVNNPAHVNRLRRWVVMVSRWPGKTNIRLVQYRPLADLPGTMRMRVRVFTVFWCSDGRREVIARNFDYGPMNPTAWPFGGIMRLDNITAGNSEQWELDIRTLLQGDSIRSMRHRYIVYEQSRSTGVRERTLQPFAAFRPKRHPDYVACLSPRLTRLRKDQCDSTFCPICNEDFDNESAEWNEPPTVRYPWTVHPTVAGMAPHAFCKPCILNWCRTRGPRLASCPTCRNPFFTQREVDHLLFDIVRNPAPACAHANEQYIFRNNPLYANWENVLRSFSDLDEHDPDSRALDSNGAEIRDWRVDVTNPHMIFDIWLDLVNADETFPDSPAHRVTGCDEWAVITTSIDESLRGLPLIEGIPYSASTIYGTLCDQAVDRLLQAVEAEVSDYIDDADIDLWVNNRDQEALERMTFWRPSIRPFLERSVRRTINFLRLRECNCAMSEQPADRPWTQWGDDELYAIRKHRHGDREFYRKDLYDEIYSGTRILRALQATGDAAEEQRLQEDAAAAEAEERRRREDEERRSREEEERRRREEEEERLRQEAEEEAEAEEEERRRQEEEDKKKKKKAKAKAASGKTTGRKRPKKDDGDAAFRPGKKTKVI